MTWVLHPMSIISPFDMGHAHLTQHSNNQCIMCHIITRPNFSTYIVTNLEISTTMHVDIQHQPQGRPTNHCSSKFAPCTHCGSHDLMTELLEFSHQQMWHKTPIVLEAQLGSNMWRNILPRLGTRFHSTCFHSHMAKFHTTVKYEHPPNQVTWMLWICYECSWMVHPKNCSEPVITIVTTLLVHRIVHWPQNCIFH